MDWLYTVSQRLQGIGFILALIALITFIFIASGFAGAIPIVIPSVLLISAGVLAGIGRAMFVRITRRGAAETAAGYWTMYSAVRRPVPIIDWKTGAVIVPANADPIEKSEFQRRISAVRRPAAD